MTKSLSFSIIVHAQCTLFSFGKARWMESLTIVANLLGASGRGSFQASFFIDHILAFTLTGIVLQTHFKKMSDFPVPSRDVTEQTLPGGKIARLLIDDICERCSCTISHKRKR